MWMARPQCDTPLVENTGPIKKRGWRPCKGTKDRPTMERHQFWCIPQFHSVLYCIDSYPLPSAKSKNLDSYFKGHQRHTPVNFFSSHFLFQFCPESGWLSRQLGTKDENKVWDSLWKSGWLYEYLYVLCNADHQIKFMCTIL
jgi:hypothetical protein